MHVASRRVTLRDFAIFQLKLALDGIKDVVVFNLSILAVVIDFLSGRGRRPRFFYGVLRLSERFDRWLNLHGVIELMHRDNTGDGMFGASPSGDDTLLGLLERMVRGGDVPRGRAEHSAAPGA